MPVAKTRQTTAATPAAEKPTVNTEPKPEAGESVGVSVADVLSGRYRFSGE